ncbi:MAG: PilN domain-containing protein [Deltaproteobacteria bacterium]|nr:PilN domain-containing protein [Deltaproteobacteria bacterium]
MAIREVNLVPADILERRHFLRHLFFWTGCLAVLMAMIWGFHFYQAKWVFAQGRHQIDLKAMERYLALKIDGIKRMKQEIERIEQKRTAIVRLSGGPPYSWILMRLTGKMNGATWLKTLAFDREEGSGLNIGVTMRGYSFENEDLGNFLNQLNADSLFDGVLLKYAREKNIPLPRQVQGEPVDVIEFQIDFTISMEM